VVRVKGNRGVRGGNNSPADSAVASDWREMARLAICLFSKGSELRSDAGQTVIG
jgi:hypothetical protein